MMFRQTCLIVLAQNLACESESPGNNKESSILHRQTDGLGTFKYTPLNVIFEKLVL
jgi:hypothetical protein